MLDSWHTFLLGGGIARQFVCDDHPWGILESFEQVLKELLCGFLVAPALYQDIEHVAMVVYCTLQIVLLALILRKPHPSAICPHV